MAHVQWTLAFRRRLAAYAYTPWELARDDKGQPYLMSYGDAEWLLGTAYEQERAAGLAKAVAVTNEELVA